MLASALTKHAEFSFKLTKKILRYLARHPALGLDFSKQQSRSNNSHEHDYAPAAALPKLRDLVVYTDAGLAGFNLKSQTEVLILWEGAAVLWRPRQQSATATSTSETVLTAGSLGAQGWACNPDWPTGARGRT